MRFAGALLGVLALSSAALAQEQVTWLKRRTIRYPPLQTLAPGKVYEVWVSRDRGATWTLTVRQTASLITVAFPEDGRYELRIVSTSGRRAVGAVAPPLWDKSIRPQVYQVDTTPPEIESFSATAKGRGGVVVAWRVFETNLSPRGKLRLESAAQDAGPWRTALTLEAPKAQDERSFMSTEELTDLRFRLTVTDSAGNSAVRTAR